MGGGSPGSRQALRAAPRPYHLGSGQRLGLGHLDAQAERRGWGEGRGAAQIHRGVRAGLEGSGAPAGKRSRGHRTPWRGDGRHPALMGGWGTGSWG